MGFDTPSAGITKTRLRREAEERGWPVSAAQLRRYLDWSLLPTPPWDLSAVDRLVRIREAGQRVGPLPRRVICLRSDYLMFPLATHVLRRALIELTPAIVEPMHKMWVVADRLGTTASRRELPRREAWVQLFEGAGDVRLESILSSVFLRLGPVEAAPEWLTAKHPVPYEERVLLLTVIQLSADAGFG